MAPIIYKVLRICFCIFKNNIRKSMQGISLKSMENPLITPSLKIPSPQAPKAPRPPGPPSTLGPQGPQGPPRTPSENNIVGSLRGNIFTRSRGYQPYGILSCVIDEGTTTDIRQPRRACSSLALHIQFKFAISTAKKYKNDTVHIQIKQRFAW